jgi:hypothetical protein
MHHADDFNASEFFTIDMTLIYAVMLIDLYQTLEAFAMYELSKASNRYFFNFLDHQCHLHLLRRLAPI